MDIILKLTSARNNNRQVFFYVSIILFLFCFLIFPLGCGQKRTMVLYTTTSVYDTGLLDELLPLFSRETGINIKPIAVGSGEAFKMGEKGNADVLLIHDKKGEKDFMSQGYGSLSQDLMFNYFVIIGPKDDPAGIKNIKEATEAFKKIAEEKCTFVSRGDDSGTNRKELAIWKKIGLTPQGEWYIDAGQGMGEVIRIASEKNAYTLSDKGTYLALKKSINLVILLEGDEALKNQYSVIVVNPDKFKNVKSNEAKEFLSWIISPEVKKIILNFGKAKYGEPLFYI